MKNKIDIPVKDSHRIINPGPVILLTASHGDSTTISAIAWHMPVSSYPKLVALALANKRYTLELIEKSGCFCINLPDYSLLEKVVFCGTYSGRDVDKFRETSLTPGPCLTIGTPCIDECRAHLECRVVQNIEAGDHHIITGEVLRACADENVFDQNGILDPGRIELIHHLGGSHFGILRKKL